MILREYVMGVWQSDDGEMIEGLPFITRYLVKCKNCKYQTTTVQSDGFGGTEQVNGCHINPLLGNDDQYCSEGDEK